MPSSLVDSIFGGANSEAAAASLFATKIDLPEPREYPALKKKRQSAADAEASSKKKRRKPKKTEEEIAQAKAAVEAVIGPRPNPDAVEQDSSDDGGGDAAADERTVFVGNLPLHYTRRALQRLFSDCGRIESTRIRSVAAAGVKLPPSLAGNQNLVKKVCSNTGRLDAAAKLSVLGYVVFCEKESVEAAVLKNNLAVEESDAVRKTNNKAVRHIRVDRVSSPARDPSRSVFVGNLPYAADEESLAKHFTDKMNLAEKSSIEGVRIVRDKDTQLCKGFGYILFADSSMAAIALSKCHETKYMQRVLRVQVCGKRTKNQKGATTQPKALSRRKAELVDSVGALKRVLTKQLVAAPRKRAERKKKVAPAAAKAKAAKAGVSKRAATEAKTGKRVKKIEKRLTKGMGKTRK